MNSEQHTGDVSGDETIAVEDMSGKQIDRLVKDNQIEVPKGWSTMKVADKRQWLLEQFGVDDGSDTETDLADVEDATTESHVFDDSEDDSAKLPAELPKSGQVLAADKLSDVVQQVSKLGRDDALTLARGLCEETGLTWFKLGGVFSVIRQNHWYEPYDSFRSYVEQEHGIKYRTASYWVEIYDHLVETNIPWDAVEVLGWTKISVMLSVLDGDNYQGWIEFAEDHTVHQIQEAVKNVEKDGQPQDLAQQVEVKTKTFKLHPDQLETVDGALEKAKKDGNTDVASVALEYICLEYLGKGTKKSPAQGVRETMESAGMDEVLKTFEEIWPDVEVRVKLP